MKSSQILREAARLVEEEACMGGCAAICIERNSYQDMDRALGWFNFLCPHNSDWSDFWWPIEFAHGPRIIGLCLAAAIAESEGD